MHSIENQYQHLSPLDAFKARGRYLHNQLKKERQDTGRAAQINDCESVDVSGAFDLDHKLQARKSNYLVVADNAPSIYSESALSDDLHRSSLYDSDAVTAMEKEGSSRSSVCGADTTEPRKSISTEPIVQLQRNFSSSTDNAPYTNPDFTFLDLGSSTSDYPPSPRTPLTQEAQFPARNSPQSSNRGQSPSLVKGLSYLDKPVTPVNPKKPGPDYPSKSSRQSANTGSPVNLDMIQGRPRALPTRALSYSPATPNSATNSAVRRPPLSVMGTSAKSLSRTNTRAKTFNNSRVASYPDAQLSAAVHIELGIEQHEANELPQSTHHFKVAADLGDPTGCLLYGLSLRHGWGIRQDLQRSITMLQKAVDSIGIDIDNTRGSKLMNTPLIGEVAVAIYELGVSYKNGWGVSPDKKLALKYFEIATTWGDVEAMVVTADCYLQGEGCKKDKAKAATYLRQAEAQGKKEIGNSWIWKPKYDSKK